MQTMEERLIGLRAMAQKMGVTEEHLRNMVLFAQHFADIPFEEGEPSEHQQCA